MNLWLRSEINKYERRTPLIPYHAGQLVELGKKIGFDIVVERSNFRIYPDKEYLDAGCKLVDEGSWVEADLNNYIVGIKGLPYGDFPLKHQHIYFAHAYKQQPMAEQLLLRFQKGGGKLYDYEYLVDSLNHRVATGFRFWAGYCSVLITLLIWDCKLNKKVPPFKIPQYCMDSKSVERDLIQKISLWPNAPKILIIGNGEVAKGVITLLKKFSLPCKLWFKQQTEKNGPFPEIMNYDILFNCIRLGHEKIKPFLTKDILSQNKNLSIISDVSCDVGNPNNPLPLYDSPTTFSNPTHRIANPLFPVDIIGIDNLPTFLPLSSSSSFSNLLMPFFMQLLTFGPNNHGSAWENSAKKFNEVIKQYKWE